VVSTYAGSGVQGFADGAATQVMFNSPSGLALDKEGNLYVTDRENHRIRKVLKDGMIS